MRLGVWGLLVGLAPFGFVSMQKPATPPVEFAGQIQPILKAKCYSCHQPSNKLGGLDLTTPAAIQKGGVSGNLFGKDSLLLRRLKEDRPGKPRMPMGFDQLPKKEMELIEAWVTQGASFESIPNLEADIRPLFKANCSGCHGPENPKAGLNLMTGDDYRRVIQPGSAANSELIRRLKGLGGKPQMPMGFKPLTPAQIGLVERWIAVGAPEKGATRTHWAYAPLQKPEVPAGTGFTHPVDSFVVQRLREEGLRLSKPASRETLLRRVTLDLTGLPPTLQEIDAFLADQKPGAYERVVDRLLASPQYGVRMARPWLDLARYADTNGYEKDNERTMWLYRDWVVDAFNKNLPFDQFTIDQLAGDLLPQPRLDQLIATGFNRNTMHNLEGGVDQDEAMYQVINDRVATTTVTWLGQTLACAQCHDHKYDPLSQKDYFRFYAFFNRNEIEERGPREISEMKYFEPELKAPTPAQAQTLREIDAGLAKVEKSLAEKKARVAEEFRVWKAHTDAPVWSPHDPAKPVERATGLRLTLVPDPELPAGGSGAAENGNFILSRVTVTQGGKPVRLAVATASFTQGGYDPNGVLDEDPETGWAVNGRVNQPHELVISFAEAVTGPITVQLASESKRWPKHQLVSYKLETTTRPHPAALLVPEADYAKVALATIPERRQYENLKQKRSAVESQIPVALVMRDRPGKGPLTAPLRHRGEFLSPGELVEAGTPEALGTPAKGNRLQLAKWLVSPKNMLTPRVQVNRLWELLFGRGLVETSENFGTQGTPPTHPELLDFLAKTYLESGWDTKAMVRLLVTSATYRQRSEATPALLKQDPENKWLARAPRFRLEGETIRDSALASAGLLSRKLGGPSVMPEQPDGVWDSPYSGERWMESTGENRYRRSLYTFWKRTAPYPLFKALDAGSRETCQVRRTRTNTPLQSLALLNDEGLFEAAQALGKQATRDGLTVTFRRVTGRRPQPQEIQRLQKLHATLKSRYQNRSTRLGNPDEAAWTGVANVLLNLDETLTRE